MKVLATIVLLSSVAFAQFGMPAIGTSSPGGGSSSKTPDQVTGLQWWFRADTGLTCSGGCSGTNAVTAWTDKSSNANNASCSATVNYAASVLNSQPGVSGGTGYCSLSSAQSATGNHSIYAVVKTGSSPGASHGLVGAPSSNDGQWFGTHGAGATQFVYESTSSDASTGLSATTGYFIGFNRNATTITYYLNGSTDGTASSSGGTTGAYTGFMGDQTAGTFWDGQVLDIFEYNTDVSSSDRKALCEYAKSRYALSITCN